MDRPAPGVACLTLNRPERLNALNADMFDAFTRSLDEAEADHEVKVLIVTGAGRGFCAGHDLDEVTDILQQTVDERILRLDHEVTRLLRVKTMTTPVIAAINGAARGGGMSLSAACDIRVASTTASFGVGFINIGIASGDAGMSWTLQRIVGPSLAAELMFTGRVMSAQEALNAGFVSRLVEPDRLLEAALEIAAAIARHDMLALRLTKKALNAAAALTFAEALDYENPWQIITMDSPYARAKNAEFLAR